MQKLSKEEEELWVLLSTTKPADLSAETKVKIEWVRVLQRWFLAPLSFQEVWVGQRLHQINSNNRNSSSRRRQYFISLVFSARTPVLKQKVDGHFFLSGFPAKGSHSLPAAAFNLRIFFKADLSKSFVPLSLLTWRQLRKGFMTQCYKRSDLLCPFQSLFAVFHLFLLPSGPGNLGAEIGLWVFGWFSDQSRIVERSRSSPLDEMLMLALC